MCELNNMPINKNADGIQRRLYGALKDNVIFHAPMHPARWHSQSAGIS